MQPIKMLKHVLCFKPMFRQHKTSREKRILLAFLSISVFLGSILSFPVLSFPTFGDASAPETLGIVPEYIERQNVEERLKVLGPNLLGDSIDLNSGSVHFSATDVSLPGNFALPVAFTRQRFSSGNAGERDQLVESVLSKTAEPTGRHSYLEDWEIDLPRVEWVYPVPLKDDGVTTTAPSSKAKDFCGTSFTMNVFPVDDAQSIADNFLKHYELSSGMQMNIPGAGKKTLLDMPKGLNWPSGTVKVTKDYWKASCISANNGAKGLLVTSPDGTQYRFNQFLYRPASAMPFTRYLNGRANPTVVPRVTSTLLATEVKDVNGNWVRYEYNPSGRLSRIYSSDSRTLSFTYSGDRLATVNANGRRWSYAYGTVGAERNLSRVTLPDQRFWDIRFNSPLWLKPDERYGCEKANQTWRITHPAGVTGTFTFGEVAHRKSRFQLTYNSRTPSCSGGEPAFRSTYDSMSVVSKRLSGTGFSTSTWNFSYGYSSGAKYTDARSPDGTRTRTTFHLLDNDDLEGLEKKVEIFSASDQLLQRTSNSYVVESALGITYQTNENPAKSLAPRLKSKTVQLLGSDTYTTTTAYNNSQTSSAYSYGKPVTVDESNNVNNLSRVTETTYEHKKSVWRLALPKTIDVNNVEHVRNTYDSLGRLTQVDKFGTMYAQFGYHGYSAYKGAIYWIDDANNNRTYVYDWKRGTPQRIKRPDGESALRAVDNNGWITKDTDFEGNCTNYRYNSIGELTLVDPCDSNWANTTIAYALTNGSEGISGVGLGMRKQTITRGNYEQVVYYDDMQRPIAEKTRDKSASNTTSYQRTSYDYYNRPTFSSFPSTSPSYGHGTRTTYDGLGRTLSIDDTTTSGTISMRYLSKNRVSKNDNKGNVEITQFVAYGSPTQDSPHIITSPENVKTTMIINSQGLVSRIVQGSHSGSGNVTESRVYDGRNRLCKIVRSDVGNTGFNYDNAGNMTWKAQGNSISSSTSSCDYYASSADTVRYTYNNINLPISVNFNDATPDRSFSYDKNGRIKNSNASGSANWSYSYNSLGLLTDETMTVDGNTFGLGYTYDSLGHLKSTRYPSGKLVYHNPNALGQATGVSGIASQATYHPNGALKAFKYGNSYSFSSTQTLNGLPYTHSHLRGSTKAIDHRMSYDANSNLTFLDDLKNSAYDLRMTYDGLDRLKGITDSYYGTGGMSYDTKGNITQYKLGSRTINYNYNSANQLTSVSGGHSASYSYDARGNVTNNRARSFTYNTGNQMVASGSNVYGYDANGKRVKEVVNGDISYSVYSQNGKLMARFEDGQDTDYYYLAGTLIGKTKSSTVTFIHSDFLGSPRIYSNSSNVLRDAQDYRPFGESNSDSGDIGYTGHKFDAELGLNYMQARYYDPVIGRFYSNDPVSFSTEDISTFNRYSYVGNNPFSYTDPTGMSRVSTCGEGGASCKSYGGATGDSTSRKSSENERTLSSYLPGTQAGSDAAQYWADIAVNSDHPLAPAAHLPGVLATLWTDETAIETAITLGTAGTGALGSRAIDLATKGYGFKIGRAEFWYKLPSINGRTYFSYKFKNGTSLRFQRGNWGKQNQPWYKQEYLKLPGQTNKHWPWQ